MRRGTHGRHAAASGAVDPRLEARLAGLERLRIAGLIDERTYEAKLARLTAAAAPAVTRATMPPAPAMPAVTADVAVHHPPPSSRPPAVTQRTAPRVPRRTVLFGGVAAVLAVAAVAGVALTIARSSSTQKPLSGGIAGTTLPRTGGAAAPDFDHLSLLRREKPTTRGVVVDQRLAQRLVEAYWPAREYVLQHRMVSEIAALEDGTAGEWDTVSCQLGCPAAAPRPIREVHVFVPKQTRYPASFLAEVLTTAPDRPGVAGGELMVFTRRGATAPWTLTFDTGLAQSYWALVEAPAATAGAFNPAPRSVGGLEPATLPSALAAYWQHWLDTGAALPGMRFVANDFTDGAAREQRGAEMRQLSQGYRVSTLWTATNGDPIWTFGMAGGAAVACGTERWRSTITATTPGATVDQPPDRSRWGGLLLPGRYSSVSEGGLRQSCFIVAPGGRTVEVAGLNGGATVMFGTPA